jgi:ABC-type Mn2+/Zn2+ transport system permease subunit
VDWLLAPFEVSFVFRALCGGLLVSAVCALVGTWVVLRGMAFLGEAMSHGMLPGVGVALLIGVHPMLGAAASAAAMTAGITVARRRSGLSQDTVIGLLFVGMLALGVVIVSRSDSFAVDLTAILFGDILAVRWSDVSVLLGALAVTLAVSVLGYRSFLALAFDPRKAHTLGLRPELAHLLLLGLITMAIVASYQAVGTLLAVGLLIAPPAAASLWVQRVPSIMALAAVLGGMATVVGLLVSWHAGTAAGATIAVVAVGLFFLSALLTYGRGTRYAVACCSQQAAQPLRRCHQPSRHPPSRRTGTSRAPRRPRTLRPGSPGWTPRGGSRSSTSQASGPHLSARSALQAA